MFWMTENLYTVSLVTKTNMSSELRFKMGMRLCTI